MIVDPKDIKQGRRTFSACLVAGLMAGALLATAETGAAAVTPELAAPSVPPLETMVLSNQAGLRWELDRRPEGWTLGELRLHGRQLDRAPAAGLLRLRKLGTADEGRWLPATEGKQLGASTARFEGKAQVQDATLTFSVEVALQPFPAATVKTRWAVDRDLDGWEVCFAYQGAGAADWRCTVYPFAGNAEALARDRLTYVGVPAVLLFRPDLSLVALFGLDPNSDYLDPTTWTGATGFAFQNRVTPPQFRAGGGKLRAGTNYELTFQLLLSEAGSSAPAITALARNWIRLNGYEVEPLTVRAPDQALALFLQGRRQSKMWTPGKGYQIMENWKVVYTAESPINAWFDYLVSEQTGEAMWRQRAFETMDFMLRAQHTDPKDPHFGVIDTNYELDHNVFNSADHSPNFGYKLDMNGYAAHYLLKLWERVKQKEGIDHREWYQAAVRIADWIVRQQNPDGGLPQVVDYRPGAKASISVISGRTLVAMPEIARITGDARYAKLATDLERFLRRKVEARFWFTGAHVDLWPKDFEADSVWHAVEYWLDKFDRTGERDCLERAEADTWFAFLMWCPKQLPWVRNPTQTCHTEQENYRQYSNYCYNNRKFYCLDKLAKLTQDPLFGQLRDRIIQCGFWAQATTGDWIGGQYERMSDPWKAVSPDVNSKGQIYVSELALDAHLQLLEMGLAHPAKAQSEILNPASATHPNRR